MRIPLPITFLALWMNFDSVQAQTPQVNQLIAQGDVADLAYKPDDALLHYLPAAKLDPNNVPLLLRIARQYRHLLSDAKTDRVKIVLGEVSLGYALRAAKLAPKDSDAQLSPAICYGKMLPFQSKQQQFDQSLLIKTAADLSLKLNPLNDSAWNVLGCWHRAVANVGSLKRAVGGAIYGKLPVSTFEEAVTCFDKAIAIHPARLRHYIELGKTYALMGQHASARIHLVKGIGLPETEKDDAALKVQGRAVLATLPKAP